MTLHVSHALGTWVAATLTLFVFSFLYKDNPLYKFAENLFVGVSAGYLMVQAYWTTIDSNLVRPLSSPRPAGLLSGSRPAGLLSGSRPAGLLSGSRPPAPTTRYSSSATAPIPSRTSRRIHRRSATTRLFGW